MGEFTQRSTHHARGERGKGSVASASAEKMGNPNDNSGDQRAEHNAKHCRACGLNEPAKETAARSERVFDRRHDVVEDSDAHLRKVLDD